MSLLPFRSDEGWNCPSMAGPDGPLLNLLQHLRPLKTAAGLKVTDLPNEILTRLPYFLACLDDWYATIRTCKRFYHICGHTKATFPAFFARNHIDGCLPVHKDLLIAGSARQVADWAVKSKRNRQEFVDAMQMEADEGLLKLGVEIARWSVGDVRALQEADVKVVGPLVKAIAAKGGATHRQDCHAARAFDKQQSCNEDETWDDDESECGLCEDLELARTSLYSFVIYCNLFHADVEKSYSQLPLKFRPLGSEIRRCWMENRMCNYDLDSQDATWSRLNLTGYFELLLRIYFGTQSSREHVGEEETNLRFKLFFRIMTHQGLDTLRLLLPNGAMAKDPASSICSKVWALSLEQVPKGKVWDSHELQTRNQIGWWSMACDEREHLRQNGIT